MAYTRNKPTEKDILSIKDIQDDGYVEAMLQAENILNDRRMGYIRKEDE